MIVAPTAPYLITSDVSLRLDGVSKIPVTRAEVQVIALHESYWHGLRDGYILGVVTVVIYAWEIYRRRR